MIKSYLDLEMESDVKAEDDKKKNPSYVLFEWEKIMDVLSTCKHPGCGDLVLHDNIVTNKNGKFFFLFKHCCLISKC